MDMTNQEYGRYVSQKAKPSPLWKNLLWAFVTGGLICTGGQALLNLLTQTGQIFFFIPERNHHIEHHIDAVFPVHHS